MSMINSNPNRLSSSSSSDVFMKSDSGSIDKDGVWYFNDGKNSPNVSWIPFGDIDNKIIEEAFNNKTKEVELDDYYIDLDKSTQIEKNNSSIQRVIKRCIRQPHEVPLRSERFYTTEKLVQSFNNNDSNDRRYINEWQKQYRRMSMTDKLEKAADGILKEGIKLGKEVEGEWLAKQLRSVIGKSNAEIEKCVISLYTHESFLYRLINETLRKNDQSKLDTLGTFVQLLFHCDCSSSMGQLGYAGELYRGAQLDEETIQSYQQAVGQSKTWDAFSSTSKNRLKAQSFGNVLFIINRDQTTRYRFSGMDISCISQYPEEEEVLVRAARNFLVEKVQRENLTGKYLIFLSLQ